MGHVQLHSIADEDRHPSFLVHQIGGGWLDLQEPWGVVAISSLLAPKAAQVAHFLSTVPKTPTFIIRRVIHG